MFAAWQSGAMMTAFACKGLNARDTYILTYVILTHTAHAQRTTQAKPPSLSRGRDIATTAHASLVSDICI